MVWIGTPIETSSTQCSTDTDTDTAGNMDMGHYNSQNKRNKHGRGHGKKTKKKWGHTWRVPCGFSTLTSVESLKRRTCTYFRHRRVSRESTHDKGFVLVNSIRHFGVWIVCRMNSICLQLFISKLMGIRGVKQNLGENVAV